MTERKLDLQASQAKAKIRKTDQFQTYRIPEVENHSLAYDPLFDIQDHQLLNCQKNRLEPEEYQRRKAQLETRTRHNLETALGERFNVQLSEIYYRAEFGQLISLEYDEPFIEVVKRGVANRREKGNPYDYEREQAELQGFTKIQEILTKPHIIPGFNVISVSPRGSQNSDYQLNFFDIYEVVNTNQTRMTRYASKMTYGQFLNAAKTINPTFESPKELTDSFFLENPIITFRSFEEILEIFHPDLETMGKEEFQNLIKACNPLTTAYIGNPSVITYNALLNFADAVVGKPTTPEVENPYTSGVDHPTFLPVEQLINYYGNLPVRPVLTGCGLQRGFSLSTNYPSIQLASPAGGLSNSYPYTVAEFGKNSCVDCGGAENHFHCPGCHGQIESGRGITTCPHCGLTKERAGSKC